MNLRRLRRALALASSLALFAPACRTRTSPERRAPRAAQVRDAAVAAGPNVILLTLDGVRWQEFFGAPDAALCAEAPARGSPECARAQEKVFAYFHGELARKGFLWGAPGSGTEAVVSNTAMFSLPAYQSLFAGEVTPCLDNDCARVGVETLGERLVRELGVPRDAAASVASWERMPLAVEHVEGATFVNAGFAPVVDPSVTSAPARAELDAMNARQATDRPPWQGARGDWWTMVHALRHLRDHRPRFLHIGLNDADEWGHLGNYRAYLGTLRQYDDWIRRVLLVLDGMGDYGRRTTLLVTTDHGRGDGARWRDHGNVPEARAIWMYAHPPGGREGLAARTRRVAHVDVRPTVEAILGMAPRACEGCGRAIDEVVAAAR